MVRTINLSISALVLSVQTIDAFLPLDGSWLRKAPSTWCPVSTKMVSKAQAKACANDEDTNMARCILDGDAGARVHFIDS